MFALGYETKLRTVGRWAVKIAASLAGLLLAVGVGGSPALAADLPGSFGGDAYGTFAKAVVGPLAVQLGKTAVVVCPCRGTNGQTRSNSINTLDVGSGVLSSGVVTSTAFADKTSTTAETIQTSTIAGLNLLGGTITADALTSVATVSATATAITGSSAGSSFLNLKVLGQPIAVTVAPNTVIGVPGVGTLTLNKVRKTGGFATTGRVLVEMLTLDIGVANGFGLPVGASIVVGHASATFTRAQPTAVTSGQAYATSANAEIGTALQTQVGKAGFVAVGCLGTDNVVHTNVVAGFSVNSILSIGTGSTSAVAGPASDGSTTVRTTASVGNAGLLGGLIKLTAIKAVAQATIKNGVITKSTAGSEFAGLKIGIITLPLNLAPNTELPLLLLGKVIINEQVVPTTGGRVDVNGLHITITNANLLGLPIGTELLIAHAQAAISRF